LFNCLLDQTSYIGEIGLDFSKEGWSTKDDQVLLLRKLLAKLEGKKKIISVHSRMAEKELFDLLCEYNINNVIFHWYSGPIDLMPSIIAKGYYFSVNEAMTVSKNGQKLLIEFHETESLQNQMLHTITKQALVKHLSIWQCQKMK
jgi:TatD DNase family protein